jgi:alkaline phosphatase
MNRFRVFTLLFLAFSFLYFTSCEAPKEEPKAKYVFLFIGDGMGLSQVIAAEAYQHAVTGGEYTPLGFRQFPGAGLSTTYAANRFITSSAAAGTALATGNKTNIGMISVDTSGTLPVQTIAEKAKIKGLKVGIISSVSIDHATPAAFYAHQPSRRMYHEISLDLAASNIDFFGGGGFSEAVREDVNVIDLAVENGFEYINDEEVFDALLPSDKKVLFVHPDLTSGASMRYAIDQPEGYITLAEITEKAIEYLDNENGFFMMVEGGKIDWLCHANDAGAMVREVLDFSAAVDVAVKFYLQHPEETLIVVTADHETGGLGLGNQQMHYESDYALLANQKVSGEDFNVVLSDWRKDNHLNIEGFKKIMNVTNEYFGFGEQEAPIVLNEQETENLYKAFRSYDISQEGEYGDYSPVTYQSTMVLTSRVGLGWTSQSHTGVAVPVYAIGVGHQAFSTSLDNTDIPKLMWEMVE